ncbi:MAG: hypothetical protein ACYC2V_08570, partial [Thiobacillus sp.]
MSENVFRRDDPNLPILMLIAKSLGDLCDSLVFVGGCATGLLLTTPRAQAIRATQDVDVVVHALSTADYHAIEKAVEARGFKHDLSPEAPHGRGNNDYLASHDLEDIITVVDGRPELMQEIDQAEGELRRYIAAEIHALLEDRNFLM